MPIFVPDEVVTAAKLNEGTARDWDDWTPTLTNLTLGSGTVVARYMEIGQGLVVAYFTFTLGSGSAVGTSPKVSLPVEASASYPDFFNLGDANLRDVTGNIHIGHIRLDSSSRTTVEVRSLGVNGQSSGVTASAPFSWASGDVLGFITLPYEGA